MPFAFRVNSESTIVRLFGGTEFTLSFSLAGKSGLTNVLVGDNGTGKTITLRSLAKVLGLPIDPIKGIKNVDTSGGLETYGFDNRQARTCYTYQKPIDNFDNSSLADNIRASLRLSDQGGEQHYSEFTSMLSGVLGLTAEDLLRRPSSFSAGQQQFMAVAIRAYSGAAFTLLDEPFSRLDYRKRKALSTNLQSWSQKTNFVVSSLPQDASVFSDDAESNTFNHIVRSKNTISLHEVYDDSATLPEVLPLADRLSDITSLNALKPIVEAGGVNVETGHSVAFVPGSGREYHEVSGGFWVYSGDNPIASTNVNIREGLNFLFGDNGNGKTIISQALTGQLYKRSFSYRVFSGVLQIKSLNYKGSILNKRQREKSFFVPSEPVILSKRTVLGELKNMDGDARDFAVRSCEILDVELDADTTAVPYSLQKIIQIALVPEDCEVVFLDEPFGSIGSELQSNLGKFIVERTRSQKWKACVVTSNRLLDTIRPLIQDVR